MTILWISFALLALAAAFDLYSREIPHFIGIALLALAIAASAFHWHAIGWLDLLVGFAVGLGAGIGFYLLGGLGGGDVKLLAALGAVIGWKAELGVLFYMAIFGGVLAVVSRLRRQREYAYAPAIALGMLAYIVRGYIRI